MHPEKRRLIDEGVLFDTDVDDEDIAIQGVWVGDCPDALKSVVYSLAALYWIETLWPDVPLSGGFWLIAFTREKAIGFLVANDWDLDDTPEELGHVWVARDFRRRGVGRLLVATAIETFGISRIQGPLTPTGEKLFRALEQNYPQVHVTVDEDA